MKGKTMEEKTKMLKEMTPAELKQFTKILLDKDEE